VLKWRSEVLRDLRNFEKKPLKKLYLWASEMPKFGVEIPDLIKIVIHNIIIVNSLFFQWLKNNILSFYHLLGDSNDGA